MAIKFDDKIAITRPDGELDVFTLPDGSSVDELCFCPHDELVVRQQSDCCEDPDCGSQMIIPERRECCDHSEAHVHAHLRSDCERGLRGTDLARNRVTLTKQVVEPSELLTPPEAQPTATVTVIRHGDCDHTDGPGCGGQKIRHGDHFDYRVEQEHGTKELHNPYKDERGVQRCVGHGVLRPNNELIGGSWRNFFTVEPVVHMVQVMKTGFSPSREIRTTLFVEGICCPSEISLIEKGAPATAGCRQGECQRSKTHYNCGS